jgi:hypothetical protein
VSHRQKHVEQCFPDQATNEERLTDKFPLIKLTKSARIDILVLVTLSHSEYLIETTGFSMW